MMIKKVTKLTKIIMAVIFSLLFLFSNINAPVFAYTSRTIFYQGKDDIYVFQGGNMNIEGALMLNSGQNIEKIVMDVVNYDNEVYKEEYVIDNIESSSVDLSNYFFELDPEIYDMEGEYYILLRAAYGDKLRLIGILRVHYSKIDEDIKYFVVSNNKMTIRKGSSFDLHEINTIYAARTLTESKKLYENYSIKSDDNSIVSTKGYTIRANEIGNTILTVKYGDFATQIEIEVKSQTNGLSTSETDILSIGQKQYIYSLLTYNYESNVNYNTMVKSLLYLYDNMNNSFQKSNYVDSYTYAKSIGFLTNEEIRASMNKTSVNYQMFGQLVSKVMRMFKEDFEFDFQKYIDELNLSNNDIVVSKKLIKLIDNIVKNEASKLELKSPFVTSGRNINDYDIVYIKEFMPEKITQRIEKEQIKYLVATAITNEELRLGRLFLYDLELDEVVFGPVTIRAQGEDEINRLEGDKRWLTQNGNTPTGYYYGYLTHNIWTWNAKSIYMSEGLLGNSKYALEGNHGILPDGSNYNRGELFIHGNRYKESADQFGNSAIKGLLDNSQGCIRMYDDFINDEVFNLNEYDIEKLKQIAYDSKDNDDPKDDYNIIEQFINAIGQEKEFIVSVFEDFQPFRVEDYHTYRNSGNAK